MGPPGGGAATAERRRDTRTGAEGSEAETGPRVKVEPSEEEPPGRAAPIAISDRAKHTIELILEQIKSLSSVEKFLLFLRLPSEVTNAVDPFRQPLNPLGNRSEIYKTISWIRTHLEEDQDISLPKQEVYNDYFNYCEKSNFKPLSQADFGKVMKQVYPRVRARRLGTRGNSRYCYSGLRRCVKLRAPLLPDLTDKPTSTEAPFTQASLNSAAWLIIKDWSEQQLGKHFANVHSLAYHLILSHSVSGVSEAASKITSAAESTSRDEKVGSNKHKEMQLQLQRKIQQRNEGKDKKRKIQSIKSDQRPSSKKCRSQSLPAASSIECNNNNGTATTNSSSSSGGHADGASSTSTSPTGTICDKTKGFTRLPTLPDFKSFQRAPPEGDPAVNKEPQPTKYKADRSTAPAAVSSHCDIVPYNLRAQQPEGHRSQQFHNDRIKIDDDDDDDGCDKDDDDGCDEVDAVLTRERINSVSNVDKDAMDEYLGTNNSQHEEELSKYFSNNNNNNVGEPSSAPDVSAHVEKLSTLRQLLEQNGIVLDAPVPIESTYIAPTVDPPLGRRVSFEDDVVVPPSPNTRRRNFSFTPISPGPRSPKSPFVSPRDTPVPKTVKKIVGGGTTKREIDLTIDVTAQDGRFNYPMSAPASPMLKKLLNSNNKVAYNPGYGLPATADPQRDVQRFFPPSTADLLSIRSQSAPIREQGTFQPFGSLYDDGREPYGGDELGLRLIESMPIDGGQFGHAYGRCVPSRSVPSTPVPFCALGGAPKGAYNSSRSYPSTPLTCDEPFSYNNVNNGDCLLNGQPIRTDGCVLGGEFDMATATTTTSLHDFDVVAGQDFDATLIEDCVLMEREFRNIEEM